MCSRISIYFYSDDGPLLLEIPDVKHYVDDIKRKHPDASFRYGVNEWELDETGVNEWELDETGLKEVLIEEWNLMVEEYQKEQDQ